MREARESRVYLAVLWLDLANAYGSILHKLVEEALKRHHVPGKISKLINVIVKSAEIERQGPMMKTEARQPSIRAFMDDLTVTTASVMGCRWILRSLEKLIAWVRMKFKPAKSRSFVGKEGRTTDKFRFSLSGTTIPTLSESLVKSLRKIFNSTLRDINAVRVEVGDMELWLTRVGKSRLPGCFKARVYQQAVFPMNLGSLFVMTP